MFFTEQQYVFMKHDFPSSVNLTCALPPNEKFGKWFWKDKDGKFKPDHGKPFEGWNEWKDWNRFWKNEKLRELLGMQNGMKNPPLPPCGVSYHPNVCIRISHILYQLHFRISYFLF